MDDNKLKASTTWNLNWDFLFNNSITIPCIIVCSVDCLLWIATIEVWMVFIEVCRHSSARYSNRQRDLTFLPVWHIYIYIYITLYMDVPNAGWKWCLVCIQKKVMLKNFIPWRQWIQPIEIVPATRFMFNTAWQKASFAYAQIWYQRHAYLKKQSLSEVQFLLPNVYNKQVCNTTWTSLTI